MDDAMQLETGAVAAMAGRFRSAGLELGRARDTFESLTSVGVEPIVAVAARTADRWVDGLRVAAVAIVEIGTELDACVAAARDRDEATAVVFREMARP